MQRLVDAAVVIIAVIVPALRLKRLKKAMHRFPSLSGADAAWLR
jgi:hypothetical protein